LPCADDFAVSSTDTPVTLAANSTSDNDEAAKPSANALCGAKKHESKRVARIRVGMGES
jgi:hypothetical protein